MAVHSVAGTLPGWLRWGRGHKEPALWFLWGPGSRRAWETQCGGTWPPPLTCRDLQGLGWVRGTGPMWGVSAPHALETPLWGQDTHTELFLLPTPLTRPFSPSSCGPGKIKAQEAGHDDARGHSCVTRQEEGARGACFSHQPGGAGLLRTAPGAWNLVSAGPTIYIRRLWTGHKLPCACDSISRPPFSLRSSWHHKSCCKQQGRRESQVLHRALDSLGPS